MIYPRTCSNPSCGKQIIWDPKLKVYVTQSSGKKHHDECNWSKRQDLLNRDDEIRISLGKLQKSVNELTVMVQNLLDRRVFT